MMANNPRWAEVGSQNNRYRASQAGIRQAALAQQALEILLSEPLAGEHIGRWIQALQHRVDHPERALGDLGATMDPPMTKHAYAALVRRALMGSGVVSGVQGP